MNEKDLNEEQIVIKKMRIFTKMASGYMLVSLMAALMGILSAFSDPPKMSFPAWFPFGLNDLSVTANFYGIFVYQNFGMLVHCLMNVSWDSLIIYLMVNIQLQFELLNYRIRKEFLVIEGDTRAKLKRLFSGYTEINM